MNTIKATAAGVITFPDDGRRMIRACVWCGKRRHVNPARKGKRDYFCSDCRAYEAMWRRRKGQAS